MKIKVKIISELLARVIDKEGITRDHAGMGQLSEKINETLNEDFFNQKYLYYNIYKKVENFKDQPEEIIGLNANYLHRLAKYVGYNDFFQFRKSFLDKSDETTGQEETSIEVNQVWLSNHRFSLFNLWRNPDLGQLGKIDGGLRFVGEKEFQILNITSFNSITMPGDGDEFWVEVSFEENGDSKTVYLANATNPLPNLNLGEIEPLYNLIQDVAPQ